MKSFVRQHISSKNDGISFSLDDKVERGSTLHDCFGSEDIDKEITVYNSLMDIINDERCNLTDREKKVMSLSLDGYELREISKILNLNYSKIYRSYHNAINKIRYSLIEKK